MEDIFAFVITFAANTAVLICPLPIAILAKSISPLSILIFAISISPVPILIFAISIAPPALMCAFVIELSALIFAKSIAAEEFIFAFVIAPDCILAVDILLAAISFSPTAFCCITTELIEFAAI